MWYIRKQQLKHLFIDIKRIRPPAQLKYSLDFQIDEDDWKEIYLRPKQLLYDHKIQETQFKILHNYVPTNRLLFKMKKIPSDKYNFCDMYLQNLYHLLYDCLVVRNFWYSVERFLEAICGQNINLTKSDVIFGRKDSDEILNKIILYAKQYIINCKTNDLHLESNIFINYFNNMIDLENAMLFKLPYVPP